MEQIILLAVIFFVIAVIYSAAGFGGGSSYLATLSLFPLAFTDVRMIALMCNIAVVSSSVFLFQRNKKIKWRKVLPLILLSVPLAFLGGKYKIEQSIFLVVLGVTLLVASLLMLWNKKIEVKKLPRFSNGIIGGGIGLLSGVVGIGGGIFLSPLLHLSRWDTPKIIASTSAVFILANSIAGLAGQIMTFGFSMDFGGVVLLLISVMLGGQIGVRLTLFKFDPIIVRRITAIVILFVSLRLLIIHLI